jgi:hypothetical protein
MAVLLVGALIATACSQPEPMSLDAYAESMNELTEAYVLESQEISLRYQLAVENQVEELVSSGANPDLQGAMVIVRSETANFLALLDDAMGRYHGGIAEMVPPDQVAGRHAAYLEIIESVRSTLPASRDALEDTTTFEQVLSSLVGSGFADGQAAWTAACESLESAIRDGGRGADLKCVRDPVGS